MYIVFPTAGAAFNSLDVSSIEIESKDEERMEVDLKVHKIGGGSVAFVKHVPAKEYEEILQQLQFQMFRIDAPAFSKP